MSRRIVALLCGNDIRALEQRSDGTEQVHDVVIVSGDPSPIEYMLVEPALPKIHELRIERPIDPFDFRNDPLMHILGPTEAEHHQRKQQKFARRRELYGTPQGGKRSPQSNQTSARSRRVG